MMSGTDGETAICLCGCSSQIEFRLVIGMHPIERLSFLDAVSDLFKQPDAGTLVDRRACGSGEAI